MRWKDKREDDIRKKMNKFLFLPMRLEGETRWLEQASWFEKTFKKYSKGGYRGYYLKWVPVQWIDN